MTKDDSDPLDKLRARREWGDEDVLLRHSVLAQTIPMLRRRRFVRRFAWALAFTICYLAGAASIGIWSFVDRPGAAFAINKSGSATFSTDNADPRHVVQDNSAQQPSFASSESTDRRKSDFEVLRDAGARALRERGDLETAIRYYSRAMKVATPYDLTISVANDDWILMSLKEAHSKESHDVGYQDNS